METKKGWNLYHTCAGTQHDRRTCGRKVAAAVCPVLLARPRLRRHQGTQRQEAWQRSMMAPGGGAREGDAQGGAHGCTAGAAARRAGRFHVQQRRSRGAAGAAGASREPAGGADAAGQGRRRWRRLVSQGAQNRGAGPLGEKRFVLASTAPASTRVPAQMAICAGGCLPASTNGAVLAGGLGSCHHRWVLHWRVDKDVCQHSSLYETKKTCTARRSAHRRASIFTYSPAA